MHRITPVYQTVNETEQSQTNLNPWRKLQYEAPRKKTKAPPEVPIQCMNRLTGKKARRWQNSNPKIKLVYKNPTPLMCLL